MKELLEKLREKLQENLKLVILIVIGLVAGSAFYFVSKDQGSMNTKDSISLPTNSLKSSDQNAKHVVKNNKIVVDVKGAVNKPSIYTVSNDLRVNDIIRLAGGFTDKADQKSINLAAKIKDEEVIYVATMEENAIPAANNTMNSGPNSTANTSNQVNINTADATELQTLSGIGPKKAQDIIDYRVQNGSFKSIEDLKKVSGFGDKTFEKLKDSIMVN